MDSHSQFHETLFNGKARRKVLLCEDDKSDQLIFKRFFKHECPDMSLVIEDNIVDAIISVGRYDFAYAVVDWRLKIDDAEALVEMLRKRNVNFCFLTGSKKEYLSDLYGDEIKIFEKDVENFDKIIKHIHEELDAIPA